MNEPIRVLHVIGSMNRGGAEAMIMNLYRQIDRSKVQFDFVENTFQPAAFDDEIRALGGRIFNCPHYEGKNHFAYLQWWNRFFREHAGEMAIVHGHLGSTAALYLSAAKKHGLYTIAHSHNTYGNSLRTNLYRLYAFPTRFIADCFFACSADAGRARFGKRVLSDPSRFFVLNNAIDTKRFAFDPAVRDATRARLHIAGNEILVGHVGRFVAQKNHPFLVDVFYEMYKRNKNVKLLLIGKEDPEKKIRTQVASLGLSDRVIFCGVQEKTEDFYQAMDVFVFPSLYEGLGMAAVEAQASGLPCIISEKVSKDCILTDKLVSVCSLKDSPASWADRAISHACDARSDCSDEVAAKGYDIHQTVKWLTDFYYSRVNQ